MGVQHAKERSFNKHVTDVSIAPRYVKDVQGHVPPQKAVTTHEGDQTTLPFCHLWRSNRLMCRFPLQMPLL